MMVFPPSSGNKRTQLINICSPAVEIIDANKENGGALIYQSAYNITIRDNFISVTY